MGFWIFMVIMNLLIPLVMIGFGRLFLKRAPKEINFVFGYRSSRSMKNRDTWEFAHKYIGRLWYVVGLILLPISIIPMFFVIGKSEDVAGIMGAVICHIQIIALIGCIFPVERALKKNFDKDGNRI